MHLSYIRRVCIGGQFKACVTDLSNNQYRCITGSNGAAKAPEYIYLTVPANQYSNVNFKVVCNLIGSILYYSCTTYVNPDGSLTKEGQRAVDCIKGGFSLGLGGLLLTGGDVPAVAAMLGILAPVTGCGNVIHIEKAGGILADIGALQTALGI